MTAPPPSPPGSQAQGWLITFRRPSSDPVHPSGTRATDDAPRSWWRGWPLAWAAVCAVCTWLVMRGDTLRVDGATFRALGGLEHDPAVHVVARTLVTGGQFWIIGVLLGLVSVWFAVRHRTLRHVVVCGALLVGLSVVAWAIKEVSGRSAPHTGTNIVLGSGISYPSGHAMFAAAGLPLLLFLLVPAHPRRALWIGNVLSVVVGFCTLVLGYHWISDVVAGLALGWAGMLCAQRVLAPRRPAV